MALSLNGLQSVEHKFMNELFMPAVHGCYPLRCKGEIHDVVLHWLRNGEVSKLNNKRLSGPAERKVRFLCAKLTLASLCGQWHVNRKTPSSVCASSERFNPLLTLNGFIEWSFVSFFF